MRFSNDIVIRNLLEKQADQNPDKVYMQQVEDGGSFTFKALYELTNKIGHGLQVVGVKQGETVLTMVPIRLESVYLWFGCSTIGAIEVPVNIAYKGNMLSHIVNDSRAKIMFIDVSFVERVLKEIENLSYLECLVLLNCREEQLNSFKITTNVEIRSWESFIENVPNTQPEMETPIAYSDAACLLYTSGTTGPSKGVIWTYAQGYENACAGASYLDGNDTFYSPFPSNHISQKLFVYRFLDTGGKLVIRNGFSVRSFWRDIRKYQCTGSGLLGAMADFIYKQPESPDDADNPLRAIFLVPLIKEVNEIRKRFNLKVYTFFNMTEICPVTFMSDEELNKNQSCGLIREGFEARLVDDDDQEVPTGKVGELILRPQEPWVFMRGYWRNPGKTAETWQNLWMHTGDVFYKDEEGYFYYVDRKKDAIRRRGENISSMEVEREIITHPTVLECAVIGVPSEYGEEEVKAVIVTMNGQDLQPKDLIEFLKERMPYFMIPRFIEFVKTLPKTPTLKVQKTSLRENALNQETWDREKAGIKVK